MLKDKTPTFAAILAFAVLPSIGSTDTLICTYNDARGAGKSGVATSWLGIKFAVNSDKGLVQRQWADGQEKPMKSDAAIKTKNFITYKIRREQENDKGRKFFINYSFRIYNNGRCSVRWQKQGYRDMIAEGVWEKM